MEVPRQQSEQTVVVSIIDFEGLKNKYFAFTSMGILLRDIPETKGLEMIKLFGSGRQNGFGIIPNFGRYVMLSIWSSEAVARDGLEHTGFLTSYWSRSTRVDHIFLKTSMVHGSWGGTQPFRISAEYDEKEPVAVITRATIKWSEMVRFWKDVPKVTRSLRKVDMQPVFAIGIGEMPFRYQATFSVWPDGATMKKFAYQSRAHADMVKKTKRLGWYEEDLFARFSITGNTGNIISGYLNR